MWVMKWKKERIRSRSIWQKNVNFYRHKKDEKEMQCMRGRIVASHIIRILGLVRYMPLYKLLSLSLYFFSRDSLFLLYVKKRESDTKADPTHAYFSFIYNFFRYQKTQGIPLHPKPKSIKKKKKKINSYSSKNCCHLWSINSQTKYDYLQKTYIIYSYNFNL